MTFPAEAPSPPDVLGPTPRTALKRHADRGDHTRATLYAILDEALVCHVAVVVDGVPRTLPTAHVRVEDVIYLHGARANRFLGAMLSGGDVCLTATIVDGIVFARTWMHHSMNFRCAMIYGRAEEVTDPAEKWAALGALIDHAASGRAAESVPPTDAELRSTLVVKVPIREGSAKIRSGPPLDGPESFDVPCWAGELPLRVAPLPARDAPDLRPDLAPSPAVIARSRFLAAPRADVYEMRRGEYLVSTDPERIDFSLVHRFLAEDSYWARGIGADAQRRAMDRSLSFGLYRGRDQIGFARVVTDGGRLAYLADVFIVGEERGKGLGTWLVEVALGHPEVVGIDLWLLGTRDAHGLYERFGFVQADSKRYMVRRAAR